MIGIYKITNTINNKCYIGQSVNIEHRWIEHKSAARNYSQKNSSALYNAINKYGIENFKFEIIEETSIEKLDEREKYWIQYYDTYYHGYNLTTGGFGGTRYDYDKIFSLWQEGYNCKEIQKLIHCDDQTVTKALRTNNITMEDVRRRINKPIPIVAIDINTNEPLKIFYSKNDASKLLTNKNNRGSNFNNAINGHYRYLGYYWEYLKEDNRPKKELSDEEFLTYQAKKLFNRSKEIKERISNSQRKVERCSREELKQLIRTTSFLQIGKKFGVTDNAIRKWCAYYNLPSKKSEIKNISDKDWNNI